MTTVPLAVAALAAGAWAVFTAVSTHRVVMAYEPTLDVKQLEGWQYCVAMYRERVDAAQAVYSVLVIGGGALVAFALAYVFSVGLAEILA